MHTTQAQLTSIFRVFDPAAPAFTGQGAYDLVSLATVKAELQLNDNAKDVDLKRWIAQSSGEAARFCNRVFPIETLQEQIYPARDAFPQIVSGGIDGPLKLKRWPLAGSPCEAGTAAPLAPVLSTSPGGALPAAGYYAVITYVTPFGETPASMESNLAVTANNLLVVTSPAADALGIATGWNVYIGTKSGQETLQNTSPLTIGTSWIEPTTGVVTLSDGSPPTFVAVIENQIPLTEGVDFLVDYRTAELTRLDINGWPKRWPPLPISVQYQAGYELTDPELGDAQDAVIRMVKGRYFAQNRDPALRQENIEGVYSATYWYASGPGAAIGNLPPDVQAILEKYRTPVIG